MKTLGRMLIWTLALLGAVLALATPARGLSIQEMTRLAGQGESTIWGLGFVVGLEATGDSAEVLPLARQLAQLLEAGGSPIPNVAELSEGQNIALVMVTCTVPKEGARRGDKLDVHVQAWHNAQSLEGGRLFITPLRGPTKATSQVYAFAEGAVSFDGESRTTGRVRGGARVSADVVMGEVVRTDGSFTLIIEPNYAGWTTSKLVAAAINSERQGLEETTFSLAQSIDERSVRVLIPEAELVDPAGFIASIQEIRLDHSLLSLPAQVIVNQAEGTIVVTGNVEISPAVISHRDLVVTTVEPSRPPTPELPRIEQSTWTSIGTNASDREETRVQNLLEALKAMAVPVEDQIAILSKLHAAGALHAELVIE